MRISKLLVPDFYSRKKRTYFSPLFLFPEGTCPYVEHGSLGLTESVVKG